MKILSFDVIVVGGGPAGLSAALVLSRCCRRVLVCDEGSPRNAASPALHGFLTRDGTPPLELLRLAREELIHYDVDYRHDRVAEVFTTDEGFEVHTAKSGHFRARKLLLTTGVVDVLPDIPGFRELYGHGVYHCPFCDAWEVRANTLVAYGGGKAGFGLACTLRSWTHDVILCLDGGEEPSEENLARLDRLEVKIRRERVQRLEDEEGHLARVVFHDGEPIPCAALFFATGQYQHSPLAERLGCRFNEKGTGITDYQERSNVPGVFLAGDASEDVQFVVVAAAEGAKAAIAIHKELLDEDFAQLG